MSLPPDKPSTWLSNEESTPAPKKSSEIIAEGSKSGQTADYLVDENLFFSAPSQPFEEASETAQEDANDDRQEDIYTEPVAKEMLPPPDFRPFFTLIEDPETGEHHHPTVHYIFSDDDREILTSAALDSLDTQQEEEIEERYLMVDLGPDGKQVTGTSSMSARWQAVHATISQAPSWGDSSRAEDRGLMLKVIGRENALLEPPKKTQRTSQSVNALVQIFNSRLDSLVDVTGKDTSSSNVQD
jgi:hypothetical protein